MNYTRMSNMILFDIGFRHVCSTSIDTTKEINAYPEKHFNQLKNVLIDFCEKCDIRYDYIDFTFIKDLFDIKKELEQLKEQYFKDYPFATNKDFENNVISTTLFFLEKIRDSNFIYSGLTIENWHFYRTSVSNTSLFYLAVDKKYDIDFIKQYANKVLELIYTIIESKENNNEKQTKEYSIDLSDAKITEKIIMLHELGILDFLRKQEPFNMSINSLASVLSAITGNNQKTIQSYINPIFSKKTSQKNNPLTKEKTKQKVLKILNQIGFTRK